MYQTFFVIPYPKGPLAKNAIFISQKRRFHRPKTMFLTGGNIVLDRSQQRPLPLAGERAEVNAIDRRGRGTEYSDQTFRRGRGSKKSSSLSPTFIA